MTHKMTHKSKEATGLFYQAYIRYFSACIFALITHKNSSRLSQARASFLESVEQVKHPKIFDDSDALIESISQLTQSIHQLVKTGFSAEVRGSICHPLEDLLNNSVDYLNSLDPRVKNDPIIFVLEDEMEALYEIQLECEDELPDDAEALGTLLTHLQDLTSCLHSLSSHPIYQA